MQGEGTLPTHMESSGLFLKQEDATGGIYFVRGECIDPLPKPEEPSALHIAGGLLGGDFLIRQDLNVKGDPTWKGCVERPD
jgi:hypothetical protein